jgi:hypothetical protein
MNFQTFAEAVDNIVRDCALENPKAAILPREKLRRIFDDVREQAVHDLAEAIRQRDAAFGKLHKKIIHQGNGR